MKGKRAVWWVGIFLAVVAAGGGVTYAVGQLGGPASGGTTTVPTTRVRRGDVSLKMYTTGELRPGQTAMIVAPRSRSTLQIVHLAKTGKRVKEGEVVVEFDPSEQQYNLEQAKSRLLEAEQEIIKAEADAEVQSAEDKVALLSAKFGVRRAELEVSRNELVSAIDAKKNNLNLEEAQRRLEQLQEDVVSRAASARAGIAVLQEKRNTARIEMQQAQQSMAEMRITAPIGGLVSVKDNMDASGGMIIGGVPLPEYREGDMVQPGRFILEILADEQMEIRGTVSQNDRASLNPGQAVEVKVDSLPGRHFKGTIKTIAGMASRGDFWSSSGPTRTFDATFELDRASLGGAPLRPGSSAQVTILGQQLKEALHLPRQALFEKDGKPVVYVRGKDSFEAKEVKILHRTESRVVLEGVAEGTEVALVNPEQQGKKPGKAPAAAGPTLSGGGR